MSKVFFKCKADATNVFHLNWQTFVPLFLPRWKRFVPPHPIVFSSGETYHCSDMALIIQLSPHLWLALGGQSLPGWCICLRAFPLRSLLVLTHVIKTREGEEAPLQSFSHVAKGQVHFLSFSPSSTLSRVRILVKSWIYAAQNFTEMELNKIYQPRLSAWHKKNWLLS